MTVKEMFRIECFCEDAKVGRIQRALASLGALNVHSVPVVDAVPKNGRVEKADGSELNGAANAVLKRARSMKLSAVTPAQAQKFLADAGMSKTSYSYALKSLQKAKKLRAKNERTGEYPLVTA